MAHHRRPTDLVRQGKIRALQRFRTEQPPYSILARGVEANVLPTCRRYGMGVQTWSPLASGFLTGRYRRGQDIDHRRRRPRSERAAA